MTNTNGWGKVAWSVRARLKMSNRRYLKQKDVSHFSKGLPA
ncbi:hypothetical protein [Polaromonas sp. AET17H-212]|nr:hypothetical protein [Polaromonas sp. AET17H-212]